MKKIFGKFTFMMLAAIIAMVSMCFVSCGSDDDDEATSTYAIELTSISGGGLSETEAAALKTSINAQMSEVSLKNITESSALSALNKYADALKSNAAIKASISETLHLTFVLKDVNQSNKVIKTVPVDITK